MLNCYFVLSGAYYLTLRIKCIPVVLLSLIYKVYIYKGYIDKVFRYHKKSTKTFTVQWSDSELLSGFYSKSTIQIYVHALQSSSFWEYSFFFFRESVNVPDFMSSLMQVIFEKKGLSGKYGLVLLKNITYNGFSLSVRRLTVSVRK